MKEKRELLMSHHTTHIFY